MKVFAYQEKIKAFTFTAEYAKLLSVLDFGWWDGRAWIGRLFSMDNDVGEHWMDNDKLTGASKALASQLGIDCNPVLVIDPARMVDGQDGPCHSDDVRRRFWIDVLSSLDLREDLIIDVAREFHLKYSTPTEVAALEERIASWARTCANP